MYLLSHPFNNSKPDLMYRVTFFIYSCIFVTLSILFFQPKHFYFLASSSFRAERWTTRLDLGNDLGGLRSIGSQKPTGLLSSVLYLVFFKMVSIATEVWRVSDGSQKPEPTANLQSLSSDRTLFTSDGLCGSWVLHVDPAVRQSRSELNSEEKRNSDF